MKEWLNAIERDYEVKILYACEAGSRAWGYASADSDQDIRFIFKHEDARKYFSLDAPLEVITIHHPYDAQGWDIQKAFRLLRKSNPNLFEWAFSSTVYVDVEGFQTQLQEQVVSGYSPYSLGMHYLSLARRNLNATTEENGFTGQDQKQLLYCLRSLLIIKGLAERLPVNGQLIPNGLQEEPNTEGSELFLKLIEAKRQGNLIVEQDRARLKQLIHKLLEELSIEVKSFEKGKNATESLNHWLWNLLGLWG
ncbi:hypothetical protein SAMN05192533_10657 [Mesobacillus persicus]|uniref:Nucleotidyltransferase n=1 Tax=Mesobacillus persicus TaxID=930146 RepID=A0A1H8BJ17_9BACI|nr:nucleotidyltransferase domain-containing protein [Mesobacillus persicus]SEM82802.1 hypothetical protein SAMN05192533_10657 [Mesobacillus persicus]